MMLSFTYGRQVLEFVKDKDHFVIVYPNTPAGRMAAKRALRGWLVNCELDFDGYDAKVLRKAIEMSRFRATFGRFSERDMRLGI